MEQLRAGAGAGIQPPPGKLAKSSSTTRQQKYLIFTQQMHRACISPCKRTRTRHGSAWASGSIPGANPAPEGSGAAGPQARLRVWQRSLRRANLCVACDTRCANLRLPPGGSARRCRPGQLPGTGPGERESGMGTGEPGVPTPAELGCAGSPCGKAFPGNKASSSPLCSPNRAAPTALRAAWECWTGEKGGTALAGAAGDEKGAELLPPGFCKKAEQ